MKITDKITIINLKDIAETILENAEYLTYTVSPIGTHPDTETIKEDLDNIIKLCKEMYEKL